MFIKAKLGWNVALPAEDVDNGLVLQRAILIRLLDAFASKGATKDLGYFMALKDLEKIGEGRIREHTGEIIFPVDFSGITFKIFPGEILTGVVHKVLKLGLFLRCGPVENIYVSNSKMSGYSFIPGENPMFMHANGSRIQINATVRFCVIDTEWKEADREFIALACLEGDHLGPL